jgi:hypothetical protein
VGRAEVEKATAFNANLTADPARGTVDFALAVQTVTLVFSGYPVPPEPPAQADDRDPIAGDDHPRRAIEAALREWGRALPRIIVLKSPNDDEGDPFSDDS